MQVRKQFRNTIQQYLDGLTERVVAKTDILLANKQYENEVIDEEKESRDVSLAIAGINYSSYKKSANNANDLIDYRQPFIITQPEKEEVVKQINKFASSMLDTDKEKIANIILDGLNQGLGPNKVSAKLRKDFGDYTKVQADRVARSELLRTANRFSELAWENQA